MSNLLLFCSWDLFSLLLILVLVHVITILFHGSSNNWVNLSCWRQAIIDFLMQTLKGSMSEKRRRRRCWFFNKFNSKITQKWKPAEMYSLLVPLNGILVEMIETYTVTLKKRKRGRLEIKFHFIWVELIWFHLCVLGLILKFEKLISLETIWEDTSLPPY